MIKEKSQIRKRYLFTQGELKAALNITGNISSISLWEGLTPVEEVTGISSDTQVLVVETVEGEFGKDADWGVKP